MPTLFERRLSLRGAAIAPPLLLAPMAGVTHSAFRRLVAGFGGYGALCTEMLSIGALRSENLLVSPFTRKRPADGATIYQLLCRAPEELGDVLERLAALEPFGIDLNLACPAPEVCKRGGGAELFDDRERLRAVLDAMRKQWRGILTVKCRLGKRREAWEETLADRLRLFEEAGVDAVTLHPRFSDEKLKRTARWDLFPRIAARTRLPLIANGDIATPSAAALALLDAGRCAGLMIGRMAIVKPWLFREFAGERVRVDYLDVWTRLFEYTCEDFRPERAIGRIKEFTAYYAQNFTYGHAFFTRVQSAPDLATIKTRATEFLFASPETVREPWVRGI